MCIEVSFLAGTDIRDAIIEAKQKATQFNVCYIKFNFNGTSFTVGKHADVDQMVDEYMNGDRKYGIVG